MLRRALTIAWTLGGVVMAGPSARAESRFFLFVSHDVPSQALIDAAAREAASAGPVVSPEVARERIGLAFPQLFAPPVGEASTLKSELAAGTAAHYATNFEQAEVHFERAFAIAHARPELLDGPTGLTQKLADAAALRYTNATASAGQTVEAEQRLAEFVRRYPNVEPTRTDHPPQAIALWEKLRADHLARAGRLMVNVWPLDLERAGGCRLLVNGAEVGRLPLAGSLPLPVGPQRVQVACGLQRSWLQRVIVGEEPLTLRVPVRAMMASRAEVRSGGIVLTAPSEGDAPALVEAISEAAGFEGAAVVQSTARRVLIGRWERGASGPSIGFRGDLEPDGIQDVEPVDGAAGGGTVAAWITGGAGVVALLGGVGANLAYLDEREAPAPDAEALDTLETASVALYAVGGALLVTSVVLFVVEGASPPSTAGLSAGPGLVRVTF